MSSQNLNAPTQILAQSSHVENEGESVNNDLSLWQKIKNRDGIYNLKAKKKKKSCSEL